MSTTIRVVGSELRPTSAASRDAPPGSTAWPSRLTGAAPCVAACVSAAWSCGVLGVTGAAGALSPEPEPEPPAPAPEPEPPPPPLLVPPPPPPPPLVLEPDGDDVLAAIARESTSRQSEYSSTSLGRSLRAWRSSESV